MQNFIAGAHGDVSVAVNLKANCDGKTIASMYCRASQPVKISSHGTMCPRVHCKMGSASGIRGAITFKR
jgi:hypothetical protein